MKKNILILLAALMIIFTGCSKKEVTEDKETDSKIQQNFDNMSEEWLVEDNWRLKINDIYETDERAFHGNADGEWLPMEKDKVYVLNYMYENLRKEDTIDRLKLEVKSIVGDNGETHFDYPLEKIDLPKDLKASEICESAEYGFSFDDQPESIKIYFNKYDKDKQEHEVVYEIDLE